MPQNDDYEPESPLDVSPFRASGFKRDAASWWKDYLGALRFYTRLPVPVSIGGEHEAPQFERMARVVPLVGLTLGLLGLFLILIVEAAGFHPLLSASFVVFGLVAMTGAFHEDGLADTADGLGGGQNRQAKLEIMKDSRLGTYGAICLLIATIIRISALAVLLEGMSPFRTGLVLIAAETLSRVSALGVAVFLPPARADGAAFAAGRPEREPLIAAAAVSLLILVLTGWTAIGFGGALCLAVACLIGTAFLALLAQEQIGGHTGDVAGAAQQVNLIAMLSVATLFV